MRKLALGNRCSIHLSYRASGNLTRSNRALSLASRRKGAFMPGLRHRLGENPLGFLHERNSSMVMVAA